MSKFKRSAGSGYLFYASDAADGREASTSVTVMECKPGWVDLCVSSSLAINVLGYSANDARTLAAELIAAADAAEARTLKVTA